MLWIRYIGPVILNSLLLPFVLRPVFRSYSYAIVYLLILSPDINTLSQQRIAYGELAKPLEPSSGSAPVLIVSGAPSSQKDETEDNAYIPVVKGMFGDICILNRPS